MPTSSLRLIVPDERDSRCRYARERVSEELAGLGIRTEAGADADYSLVLEVDSALGPPVGGGFELTWRPPVDQAQLYDPYYVAHHSQEQPTTAPTGRIRAGGGDGLMAGVAEFVERTSVRGALPERPVAVRRRPHLSFRSACLLLMKRGSYTIPITVREFPWFYDRAWWVMYLDFLALRRYNAVTLWNFHPFPYFLSIPGFPEATELDDVDMELNRRMLDFLDEEFRRRGMWLIFHFYNVYVPPSFASAHGIPGLGNAVPTKATKTVNAYTRSCVRTFMGTYPSIGLMACVGEGVPAGEAELFAGSVLVPAAKESGSTAPLIVRQCSTLEPEPFARHVLGGYGNLYAMVKHNAEHIAGTVPDSRIHEWTELGIPVIANFHMLSEVGPFRWAPPSYIRRCCLHYRALGVDGVHVYPHWSWRTPAVGDAKFAGDELERDWLYHQAWGRYAFDAVRDEEEEERYWLRELREDGLDYTEARSALTFYERSGRALPRIQQHLWIHYDNHSVLTAGFTLGQMRLARSMHGGKAIATDKLFDVLPYRQQVRGRKPVGFDYILGEALLRSRDDAEVSAEALRAAGCDDSDSPLRFLMADTRGIARTVECIRLKAQAAAHVYRFGMNDAADHLREGLAALEASVAVFREQTADMGQWYEGISDVPPLYPICDYHSPRMPYGWHDCLRLYEQELKNVKAAGAVVRDGSAWNLLWNPISIGDDPYHELAVSITSEGLWLVGRPDFFEWPWKFHLLRSAVLLPSDTWDDGGITILSCTDAWREWFLHGGQLTVYTDPGRRFRERTFVEAVLGHRIETKVVTRGKRERLAVRPDDCAGSWTMQEREGEWGIAGTYTEGEGLAVVIPTES